MNEIECYNYFKELNLMIVHFRDVFINGLNVHHMYRPNELK